MMPLWTLDDVFMLSAEVDILQKAWPQPLDYIVQIFMVVTRALHFRTRYIILISEITFTKRNFYNAMESIIDIL